MKTLTIADLSDKIGEQVTFTYPNQKTGGREVRSVNLEEVKECGNGATIIVGRDATRNNEYRSFNITKMQMIG
jgi:hypothetical protein